MSWQQGQQTGAMGAVRQSQNARARVVVHSGWLRKQGDVRKNWKKRWFELTNDFTLRYYDAQTEPREQKGAIVLHMYRVEAPFQPRHTVTTLQGPKCSGAAPRCCGARCMDLCLGVT